MSDTITETHAPATASHRSHRRALWLILALACLIGFAFQGSRGLYETTEGRYAEAAREMLETGNWWIPQLDHHPHLTKPPLTYWAIAGGMALLGQNDWGVRLYLAIAFVLMVWAMYRIARLLWDEKTGLLAASLYACAPAAVYGLCSVSTDQLLALFELLMVLCYCHLWRGVGSPRWWRIGFWLCVGLGFLTKGPLPLLLVAALGLHSLHLRRQGLARLRLFSGPGPWLGTALGLSWFVLLLWQNPSLWSFFVGQEVYGRVFTAQHHRNPQWYAPFSVYLPILLFGLGPAMLVWFRVAKTFPWKQWRQQLTSSPKAALFLLWVAVPLVVLCISRSRLPLYVLPLFPAIVLATARVLQANYPGPAGFARIRNYIVGMAIAVIVAKGVLCHVQVKSDSRRLYQAVQQVMPNDSLCVIFENEALYGLEFYLRGHTERIHHPPPDQPSVRPDLEAELARHQGHTNILFVSEGKHTSEELRALLAEAHLSVARSLDLDRYSLLLVALPKSH